MLVLSVHPSIHPSVSDKGGLEPIPAVIGQKHKQKNLKLKNKQTLIHFMKMIFKCVSK